MATPADDGITAAKEEAKMVAKRVRLELTDRELRMLRDAFDTWAEMTVDMESGEKLDQDIAADLMAVGRLQAVLEFACRSCSYCGHAGSEVRK